MKQLKFKKIEIFEPFFWIYFVWYYLPFARAIFHSTRYNQIFFGIFALGCALCLVKYIATKKAISFKYNPLLPVLAYFLFFLLLVILDVSTAGRHIRISFTFWGTLIAYYLTSAYPNAQKRIVKLVLCMLLVTSITSLVGVIADPRAARTLTYANNDILEDLAIKMKNIGGLEFFQGLVICVPILLTFIFKNKYKIFSTISLLLVFVSLLSASFTIALTVFFVALALGVWFNNSSSLRAVIILVLLVAVLAIPWSNVIMYISNNISNSTISDRLQSIALSLSSGSAEGDLFSRVDLYSASLKTFLENPLGVGPEYTYVDYEKGIGYHSQLLDDLARYGFLALIFYVAFFVGYFKLLRKQWSRINLPQVALPITAVYLVFLILNPGFTSAHEGVLLLFLIPAFPNILCQNEKATVKEI